MKVLLINNTFYRRGGADAVLFNTAQLLQEAGHSVVYFSFNDENNIECEQSNYFVNKGGKFAQIKNYIYNQEAAHKIEKLIDDEHPDIAHLHLFWGGLSSSILEVLKRKHVPIVHTAHDYRMVCPAYLFKDGKGNHCARCKNGKFYQCILHRCSKGSLVESLIMTLEMYYRNWRRHPAKFIDGIIFVSNFSKNKHIEFDERFVNTKTLVLYNCPDELVKEIDVSNLRASYNYFLFYGRLSSEKGVPNLIRAFEQFPNLLLKIVGTGPMEEKLKRYCIEHNVSNISFEGFKSGQELYEMVANAMYVCVPSECYENNPMTIVESYSLRTPVLGANIGGISEIVKEGETGFTFESGNLESLKSAIGRASTVMPQDYIRLKDNAYSFAELNFSRESHKEKLLAFYKELIEE
jgi:glycosyltransferase involved in cell wall biosynthesis